MFSRDGISISPPRISLLYEISHLQTEKVENIKQEVKPDLHTSDSVPSELEKNLKSQAEAEDSPPTRTERKQRSPVKEEEIPPPKPERRKSQTKIDETLIFKTEIKPQLSHTEAEHPPPKPERTFKSPCRKEEIPPPKPERKPKSSIDKEEQTVIETEQLNHSKPDIPPKPCVPPKPGATSKPVIPPRTNSESNKFAFAKPKTPPKPGDKPVPPPRPDKTPDKSLKESVQQVQSTEMSGVDKTGNDRKDSFSNKSTGSSSQDQQSKRFSSLSAGAAVTWNKDHCDGDVFMKSRSPASASTIRSRDSRHSSHSDNFLKPLCATNSLSTSVGFLVERKHSPIPKPRTEKQLKEKTKDSAPKRHLHRSHSDLSSCRHSRTSSDFSDLSSMISRTSTEVERFFSEMGIDRTVLDPMLRMHENTNDNLDSFSSLDSQEARSLSSRISCGGDLDQVPAESEQDLMERSTTGTSVVERNARIIKWLCNVKKAKGANPNVNTKQSKVAKV